MEELTDHLVAGGYRGRVIGIDCVGEVVREIDGRRSSGAISEKLYTEYLSGYSAELPEDLPDAKSVILATAPSPQVRTFITIEGKRLPVVIPPTYADWDEKREAMAACLREFLDKRGYSLRRAFLPEKLLATRSGLARYGKNNISYVPGLGSFHRPAAFYSDMPTPVSALGEPQVLELCRNCSACLKACPTGAITEDRFLLRAERCLTFLNELPGDWPEWLDPAWHNCVVGCMRCQLACPADRGVWQWFEDREGFDEEETRLILEGSGFKDLGPETLAKLKHLRLTHYEAELGRNLAALVPQLR